LTGLVVSDYPGYYTALFGEGLGTLFFQFFFSLDLWRDTRAKYKQWQIKNNNDDIK